MAKVFNISSVCRSKEHYMVNIEERLKEIKHMIDAGKYFTINKARQYGKTTILLALEQYLQKDYHVVLMDFQTFGNDEFANENVFSLAFAASFIQLLSETDILIVGEMRKIIEQIRIYVDEEWGSYRLKRLFEHISNICALSDRPIVLIIDEVDNAVNNQVFIEFLAQIRAYYIQRDKWPIFQSVILTGVCHVTGRRMIADIRSSGYVFRPEEEHKLNSPWNIAAEFKVGLSFSKEDIAGMLLEYEADYHTGMKVNEMAGLIYDCTSGYPFLVSRLCKLIDEDISERKKSKADAWTADGFIEANQILITERNTLFESLVEKVIHYPELNAILQDKIFNGKTVAYTATNPVIDLAATFGIIKNVNGVAVPANKIFAKVLSDYYLSLNEMKNIEIHKTFIQDKNQLGNLAAY